MAVTFETGGRHFPILRVSCPEGPDGVDRLIRYVRLVGFAPDLRSFQADLCDRWDASTDARTFAFHLRSGLRWSDGRELTSADIRFALEQVIRNPASGINASLPAGLDVEGLTVETPDRLRVVFHLSRPFGMFLHEIASGPLGELLVSFPAHSFAPLLPGSLASAADWRAHPELPQCQPWVLEAPAGPDGSTTWVRNRFFHRVDSSGTRLPYADRIVLVPVLPGHENEAVAAGRVDLAFGTEGQVGPAAAQVPAEQAGVRISRLRSPARGTQALFLNETFPDPRVRRLFSDPGFRFAVSLALDRRRIAEQAYGGTVLPRQASFSRLDMYPDPDWPIAYAAHDPTRAGRMLDDLGLRQLPGEMFRRAPEGGRLRILLEYDSSVPGDGAAARFACSDMAAVGLDARAVPRGQAELEKRIRENRVAAGIGEWGISIRTLGLFLPSGVRQRMWGPAWADWFESGGTRGEAPPVRLRALGGYLAAAQATGWERERQRLIREMVGYHRESLYVIGLVGEPEFLQAALSSRVAGFHQDAAAGAWIPTPAGTAPLDRVWLR